jgi:hypothetical protein
MNPSPSGPGDDSPAQTNLGLLLQRALAAQQTAQQTSEVPEQEQPSSQDEESGVGAGTKLCANCWHAKVFKAPDGRQMARCEKNLWVRPFYTYEDLNANRVRRWYADCPEYDDSE